MRKKVFILVVGTLILSPVFFALCCNSLIIVCVVIVYAVMLWYSPKFSVRVRKFWLEFWKINMKLMSTME